LGKIVVGNLTSIGERNRTRRFWSIPNANDHVQIEPTATLSIPNCPSSGKTLPEHANSYIPNDFPGLLSLGDCSDGNNEWPSDGLHSTQRKDVLFRQVAQDDNTPNPLPPGQMSLPRFSAQFAVDDMSMQVADTDAHFQPQSGSTQRTGTCQDPLLSPISMLDADVQINTEPTRSNQRQGPLRTHNRPRRKSASRAEQMISDVENLYEFGIRLSIFPEDPMLRNSLRRMKERFRNLIHTDVSCDQRDMHDVFSSETDGDE
jgi:hypothetical protein